MKRPQWQLDGVEPDYRFSLANERTFLAWIRTALAIVAAAVLLHQLSPQAGSTAVHLIAVALAVLGGGMAILAYLRWKANEIAMRHSRPLASSYSVAALSLGGFAIALAVGLFVALSSR